MLLLGGTRIRYKIQRDPNPHTNPLDCSYRAPSSPTNRYIRQSYQHQHRRYVIGSQARTYEECEIILLTITSCLQGNRSGLYYYGRHGLGNQHADRLRDNHLDNHHHRNKQARNRAILRTQPRRLGLAPYAGSPSPPIHPFFLSGRARDTSPRDCGRRDHKCRL
jgi:hypothetical protein